MQGLFRLAAALALMLWLSAGAHAGGFDDVILSSVKDAETSEASFAPDTPELFLSATITDEIASGSKVNVLWIAIDTGGAAPDGYKINESSYDVGATDNQLDASLTTPTNGWPVGTYQVQLVANGKLEETVDFEVK